MARGVLFRFVANFASRIGSAFADAQQAVKRMNKLIDAAHLDYPDQ